MEALRLDIEKAFLWTDSTSVLNWINNTSCRFSKFVARNIEKIEIRTAGDDFRYVPTKLNPADLASRGCSPKQANSDSLWLKGPPFLYEPENRWPVLDTQEKKQNVKESSDEKEHAIVQCCALHTERDEEPSASLPSSVNDGEAGPQQMDDDETNMPLTRLKPMPTAICELVHKSSSLDKLLVNMSLRRRWVIGILHRALPDHFNASHTGVVSVKELEAAESEAVRVTQQEYYGHEVLARIQQLGFTKALEKLKGEDLKRVKAIMNLLPYIDQDGILRVGGRLHRSDLPFSTKHQMILPKRHQFTKLIIEKAHQTNGHAGHNWVLSVVRQKYWIVNGVCTTKHYLQNCLFCKERRATTGSQVMAALPHSRVSQPKYPFERVGVDYWGPMIVVNRRKREKRWGAVFTCMATHTCHLEPVQDMTTSAFIQTYMRFLNRRGMCTRVIHSDNGTNFIGAEAEFKKLAAQLKGCTSDIEEQLCPLGSIDPELAHGIESLDHKRIKQVLAKRCVEVQWHFNPPCASHQGGVWERMIRSVHHIMCAIIQKGIISIPALKAKSPSDFELSTILTEVESILNRRPITSLSDDPSDVQALTPHSILTGVLHPDSPVDIFNSAAQYRRNWQYTQIAAEQFWMLWRKLYLPWLQIRQKWFKVTKNPAVGDLVMVLDVDADKEERNWYPKARITEAHLDRFGNVRSVGCKLADGRVFVRDVRKIVFLESFGAERQDTA